MYSVKLSWVFQVTRGTMIFPSHELGIGMLALLSIDKQKPAAWWNVFASTPFLFTQASLSPWLLLSTYPYHIQTLPSNYPWIHWSALISPIHRLPWLSLVESHIQQCLKPERPWDTVHRAWTVEPDRVQVLAVQLVLEKLANLLKL